MEKDEIRGIVTDILEENILKSVLNEESRDLSENNEPASDIGIFPDILEENTLKSVLNEESRDLSKNNEPASDILLDNTSIENETFVTPECNLSRSRPDYQFGKFIPLTEDYETYKHHHNSEHYLKGCKWSPDGTCLLTSCVDKKLRLYDLPSDLFSAKTWKSDTHLPKLDISLKVEEGGLIYDYCWFPLMNSWDPISSCFISTPFEEPVHLWDAFTGDLRASYRTYNYADELISAYSVAFNPTGERIYCGFRDSIRIFDTAVPGRKSRCVNVKAETGQMGIISCVAFNSTSPNVYAVGTYQKEIGLYSEEIGSGVCLFKGHSGGITHIVFSPDGNRLYSGSRKDSEIVCWDVRNPGAVLFSLLRTVSTNQRIYFDLTPDGSILVTGNTNGSVGIWNVNDISCNNDIPVEMQKSFKAHNDCCNGISINPVCPVLATTSGQRHVPDLISESDDSDDVDDVSDDGGVSEEKRRKKDTDAFFDITSLKRKIEDCIKLWWVGNVD